MELKGTLNEPCLWPVMGVFFIKITKMMGDEDLAPVLAVMYRHNGIGCYFK
jgi:hypothetical protein